MMMNNLNLNLELFYRERVYPNLSDDIARVQV
jgi:hypothetical protein